VDPGGACRRWMDPCADRPSASGERRLRRPEQRDQRGASKERRARRARDESMSSF
jgi:hypothetical protein